MTENLYVDPAHRVPDDQWAKVVKDAEAINAAHLEDKTGGASSPAGPLVNMLGSGKHSGVSGIPTQLLVLHSGECPLRGGYAQSLTNWANTPIEQGGPIASWHWFIDPIARVRMIEEAYAAWHASEANPISEGFEQSGYARFSRAEWLTPDGLLQMESLAYTMAQRAKVNNIPARWLSNAEVTRATDGDRSVKGFCLHRQIDPETRTDPGDGYPYELLMAKVKAYMGGTVTTQSTPEPTKEWFEMPIPKADLDKISKAVWQMPGIEGAAGQKQTMWRTVADLAKESRQNTATIAGLTRVLASGSGLTEDQITEAVKAAFVELVKE